MADLLLNKQINVWRGPSEPPTKYHLWVRGDRQLRLHDGTQWQTFLDNPGLSVSSNADGSVTVANGDTSFILAVSGTSLQISRKGTSITIESSAINTIPTDEWLNWTGQLLLHNDAMPELSIATYGPNVDSSGTSAFQVPYISIDKKGHVVDGGTHTVSIPDKVVQNPVSETETNSYEVILAGSSSTERETGEVNKDSSVKLQITYAGGETTKKLITPEIETDGGATINGNLVVPQGYKIKGSIEGNVTGTATPTDHADPTEKYGVGTSGSLENGITAVYGHVKLQDVVPTEAPPAGFVTAGQGIAASPLMVYNAMQEAKQYADNLFSEDFVKTNNKYNLNWDEI